MRKLTIKIIYFLLLPVLIACFAVPLSAQTNKAENIPQETITSTQAISTETQTETSTEIEDTSAEPAPLFLHEKQEHENGVTKTIQEVTKNYAYGVHYPVTGYTSVDSRIETAAKEIAAGFAEDCKAAWAQDRAVMQADYKTYISTDAKDGGAGTYKLMSVVFETYPDIAGNAAQEETVRTLLFDLNTGKQLSKDDVFGRNYLELIAGKTAGYFAGAAEYADYINNDHFSANTSPKSENFLNFALLPGEAVFYFDRGRILPGKFGCPSVSVPLSALYEVMKIKATAREPVRMFAPGEKMVALTFDDGPKPPYTDRILDLLQKQGGRATFFVLGMMINRYPDTMKRAYLNGCDIEDHSFNHTKMTLDMSEDDIRNQISSCADLITGVTGKPPGFFRMPYGFNNINVDNISNMPIIGWNIDTIDWSNSDPSKENRTTEQREQDKQKTLDRVLNNVQDGDIILMHDIYQYTTDVCETLIPELTARGFQLVTLNELFAARGIVPENGKHYNKVRP